MGLLVVAIVTAACAFDNPALESAITAVKQQAERKEYLAAANALGPLLTNPLYHAEFAKAWGTQGEPWALFYFNQYFWWLECARQNVATAEIERVLATYAEPARGKRWPDYKALHDRLIFVFSCNRQNPQGSYAQSLCARGVCYDPTDPLRMACLLQFLENASTNEVNEWLAVYQGPPFPELILFQARQARRAGGSAFPFALQCLATFPTSSFEIIRTAVKYARAALDAANVKQVRSYYMAIVTAGLRQNNDEQSLPCIAFLINEKKRLEAVMPELRAVYAEEVDKQ
ncbi:MAG: hypothetical protein NTV22_15955 [bacterium]|nr:hypothetical protein [bacterium]